MADLQETVGTTIRRARRDRRLKLKELAARSALSVVYLGEIERGKKYPSARVLEELARALEMDISELLSLIAAELRQATAPLLLPQRPAVLPRAASDDATPQASLAAVFAPEAVAVIAVLGGVYGSFISDLRPPLPVVMAR
ncbi:MAG: helix-turn-helix transcriptional regulator [Ktedonobacterales bacterium]|nr:helix-turn-helix transcriptional regulator [Ktedonobacterales bacterium]